jgi:hypothetical protein
MIPSFKVEESHAGRAKNAMGKYVRILYKKRPWGSHGLLLVKI